MNQQSEHLSNAQIEQYGSPASGAGPETEAWVEQHLDDCPSCRGRVLEFQRTRFSILSDPNVNTAPSSNCPSEDDLRTLAAGLCSDPLSAELTAHAAACGHCGPLLQEYREDFSDDVTPEEQTALAQLRSASPKWQQQKAREMLKQVRTPVPYPSPRWTFPWRWALIPVAAAACAAIAVSIWYTQRDTPAKAQKLLSEAYTANRTIEMRWPETKWGEPRETLGADEGKKVLPLRAANNILQRQRPETLKKAEWLHLRAQSEILGATSPQELQKLQQLIDDLTNATRSQPASPSLMFDLAIANFRLGEATTDRDRRRDYYMRCKEILDDMVAAFPPSSVTLFDRAIVEQRLQLRDSAINDFKQAGDMESDLAWLAEIQSKLKD